MGLPSNPNQSFRSKLMGYQLALMFNQVEIGYQQPALLRLFKFPHWAIIHFHSDCIARRRVAVWSGGNLCVTKSHLISCRLPGQCRSRTHLCSQLYTRKHTQRHVCVYARAHRSPPPPPTKAHFLLADAPGGCVYVSVWVCSSDFAKYEIRMYFSICVLLHLTCSTTAMLIWTLVQEFCYFPHPPSSETVQCCIYGSLLLCERHSNDFVVQSTVQWGMSIYSSLRAISQ